MSEVRIFYSENEKNLLKKKMKALEAALGINAKELSKRCGISDATVYRIEGRNKQKAGISEKLMRKICGKTGVDPDWMLDFEDDSEQVVWKNKPTEIEAASSPKERIRMVRKEMNLSQKEFAEMIGTSLSNYCAIEQGRVRLTKEMAKNLAEKTDNQFGGEEWLLTGEERNRIYPVNEEMIDWLKDHQEEREIIWAKIKKEAT